MHLSDHHIRRTALKLVRAYGADALTEARRWVRHFAETADAAERRAWTRICLDIRELRRTGDTRQAA